MLTASQARETFHYCFLEYLYRNSDPKLYVLKGGVNLRFFFNSPRYSEDMDLDVLGGAVATLKKNGFKILEDKSFHRLLKSQGIESLEVNDPRKAKQTETTQRFRVGLGGFFRQEFARKHTRKKTREEAQARLLSLTFEEFRGQVVEFLDEETKERFQSEAPWTELRQTLVGLLE